MSWSSRAATRRYLPAGQRNVSIPEQAVMHQQKRRWLARLEGGDHPVDRGLGCIHCRHDSPNSAAVFDLEAVDRSWLVGDLVDPEIFIQIGDQLRQRNSKLTSATSWPPSWQAAEPRPTFHLR